MEAIHPAHIRTVPPFAVAVMFVAMIGIGSVGWHAWTLRGHRANSRAYQRVEIGMPAERLTGVVGREPDCVVRIKQSQALYYAADEEGVRCLLRATVASELPHAYASLQVLVGPDGQVAAVGFEGEGLVRSGMGALTVGSLAALPTASIE
jgi:hypothetical protein